MSGRWSLEHQDHDRRMFEPRRLVRREDAVGAGHAHVHDDEVRRARLEPIEGRLARSRAADGLEAGRCLDHLLGDDEEVWLVVHDEDADVAAGAPPVH
jgi:hypothetical protein